MWLACTAYGQDDLSRVVKEYYRVDPLAGTFSGFIDALSSDTALHNKQVLKQTDTTGYYLRGNYKVFNPFSINAAKVDVIFYEKAVRSTEQRFLFSYYNYQIVAFFPDTERNRKVVKRDYKKLVRKLRRSLFYTNVVDLKGYNNLEDGEITTLNDWATLELAPITVSWQTLGESRHLAITLLLRIKQDNNYAVPLHGLRPF